MKKYELVLDNKINFCGRTLYRIIALKKITLVDGTEIKTGDLGGYVESENNLRHEGAAWIGDDAVVCGSAKVYDSATVCGSAKVFDSAKVYGSAKVCDHVEIHASAKIHGSACLHGYTKIYNSAEISNNQEFLTINSICNCSCTFYKTKNNQIGVAYDWDFYLLEDFEDYVEEEWYGVHKQTAKAAIVLAKAHIKLKNYPYGFCENCQKEFTKELRFKYVITNCPWCGDKVRNPDIPF